MSDSDNFSHIPDGYTSVTPSLTVRDANTALEFYAAAFGATELFRMPDEKNNKIMHCEFRIGNSTVMMSDEYPEMNCVAPEIAKGAAFMIYVADADEVFRTAIEAGATELSPVADMFWGDKMGQVADPFGYRWSITQKVKDLSPEEIAAGAQEWSKNA